MVNGPAMWDAPNTNSAQSNAQVKHSMCEHAQGMQRNERGTDQTISVQKIDDKVNTQVKSKKKEVAIP